MLQRFVSMGCLVVLLAGSTHGDGPAPKDKPAQVEGEFLPLQVSPYQPENSQPAGPDKRLLEDLSRIRRQMGGGVLSGSTLKPKPGESEATFETHLHTLLKNTEPPADPATQPKFDQEPSTSSTVKALRRESQILEGIANQLELIRQYRQADAVRESAKSLRELARRLDPPGRATASPGGIIGNIGAKPSSSN